MDSLKSLQVSSKQGHKPSKKDILAKLEIEIDQIRRHFIVLFLHPWPQTTVTPCLQFLATLLITLNGMKARFIKKIGRDQPGLDEWV
jgi:hypothetical protein